MACGGEIEHYALAWICKIKPVSSNVYDKLNCKCLALSLLLMARGVFRRFMDQVAVHG